MLTPAQRTEFEAAARPWLRSALRRGLLIGFALGFTAACIIVWAAGGR